MGKRFGYRARPGVPPPPGSSVAQNLGCTCPNDINAAVAEAVEHGEASWVVDDTCPVHGMNQGIPPRVKLTQGTSMSGVLDEVRADRVGGEPEGS